MNWRYTNKIVSKKLNPLLDALFTPVSNCCHVRWAAVRHRWSFHDLIEIPFLIRYRIITIMYEQACAPPEGIELGWCAHTGLKYSAVLVSPEVYRSNINQFSPIHGKEHMVRWIIFPTYVLTFFRPTEFKRLAHSVSGSIKWREKNNCNHCHVSDGPRFILVYLDINFQSKTTPNCSAPLPNSSTGVTRNTFTTWEPTAIKHVTKVTLLSLFCYIEYCF